jgi:hypothetical protein
MLSGFLSGARDRVDVWFLDVEEKKFGVVK